MNTTALHPDDPRLTAYALGELDVAERAVIERELSIRPELRAEVEQIQATAGVLTRAFEQEPVTADAASRTEAGTKKPRRVLRKWIAAVCATAAAAVVLALVYPALQPASSAGRVAYLSDSSRSMAVEEAETADAVIAYPSKTHPARFGRDVERESLLGDRVAAAPQPNAVPATGPSGEKSEVNQPSFDRPDSLRRPGSPASSTSTRTYALKDPNAAIPPGYGYGLPDQRSYAGAGVEFATSGKSISGMEKSDGNIRLRMQWRRIPTTGFASTGFREIAVPDGVELPPDLESAESYNAIIENPFIPPHGEQALSTFSIDVDTASYSNVRRFLKHGQLPPSDAVRIEELVNYFDYNYPQPPDGVPFSVTTEVAACPWEPAHRLVRIGLKGREIERDKRPVSNLVFLLDISGSMQDANKLPLVKAGMELLVEQLNENDRISIVTYAGNAGLVLEPTSGDDKDRILSAIRGLNAGGSTNGEAGIKLAYTQAIKNFTDNGSNRVILCTDGDFNVGVSSDDELVAMIQEQAKRSRVFLSIFGFGMGNLKDAKLEQLANKGNGHYGYIDDLREARKVFSEELMGTLYTIAKDVKIQVEFNPAQVGAYRLIGYENRALAARDFADDTKDAGEIGAGHTVTTLYEVAPVGQVPVGETVELRYQGSGVRGQESGVRGQVSEGKPAGGAPEDEALRRELLTVKLRYKLPEGDTSVPLEFPLVDHPDKSLRSSPDFDWAAAVAAFGMVLRNSQYKGQADLGLVYELAQGGLGPEPSEHRREFLDLIDAARAVIKPAEQAGTDPEERSLR